MPQPPPSLEQFNSEPRPPEKHGIGAGQDFKSLLRLLGDEHARLNQELATLRIENAKLRKRLNAKTCKEDEEILVISDETYGGLKDLEHVAGVEPETLQPYSSDAYCNALSGEESHNDAVIPHRSSSNERSSLTVETDPEGVMMSIAEIQSSGLHPEMLFGSTSHLLWVRVISATGLRDADWMPNNMSDPYCVLRLEGEYSGTDAASMQTRVVDDNCNPVWNHDFVITNYRPGSTLVFEIYDKDWGLKEWVSFGDLLGKAVLPCKEFEANQFSNESGAEVPLTDTGNSEAYLAVMIRLEPIELVNGSGLAMLPNWFRILQNGTPKISSSEPLRCSRMGEVRVSLQSTETSRVPRFLKPLDPGSPLRLTWDLIGLIVLLTELFWIPMQVFEPPPTVGVVTLGWITLIYWTADVFATFNSSVYTRQGKLINRRSVIARQYCRGWLPFDLLLIGIDWAQIIIQGGQKSDGVGVARVARLVRLMRLMRLLRLMRIGKIRSLLFKVEAYIDSETTMVNFAVGRNLFCILVFNHFLACLWYLIGHSNQQGWVRKNDYTVSDFGEKYVVSLQWSLAQFTPGAPPLHPKTLEERIFHCIVLALALAVATIFISSITSAMGAAWTAKRNASTQTFLLRKYLSQNKISFDLSARITRYIGCVLELRSKKIPVTQVQYVGLLSAPLYNQLQTEISLPFLEAHPFFLSYKTHGRLSIEVLCTKLGQTYFAQNDWVFSQASPSLHMNFITHGNGAYQCFLPGPFHKQYAKITEHQWCCEGVLWMDWAHLGILKATMELTMMTLKPKDLLESVSGNAHIYDLARSRAQDFLRDSKALEVFNLGPTDLPLDIITGRGAVEKKRLGIRQSVARVVVDENCWDKDELYGDEEASVLPGHHS